MAEEIKKETTKIRVIVNDVYNKDHVKQNFYEYQIVLTDKGGRLQRLKWKRDVNLSQFEGLKKFEVEVDYIKEASNYEYPVYWASGVHYDTINPLVKR